MQVDRLVSLVKLLSEELGQDSREHHLHHLPVLPLRLHSCEPDWQQTVPPLQAPTLASQPGWQPRGSLLDGSKAYAEPAPPHSLQDPGFQFRPHSASHRARDQPHRSDACLHSLYP